MALAPLADKWRAFGWHACEVDGHDFDGRWRAVAAVPDGSGKPLAIVAHTVKGKGVSFMEDDNNWHYRIPDRREVAGRAEGAWPVMRNASPPRSPILPPDDRVVVLLSGDIGNRLFDNFKAQYPRPLFQLRRRRGQHDRRGRRLAMCGLRPVAYTITPFITTRCLEQIRVDVCYHNVPVMIVGVGAGFPTRRSAPRTIPARTSPSCASCRT